MKNLKKIILAVLLIAALITAVVVSAIAADGDGAASYTGTVADARALLEAVADKTTNTEKSAQLKQVYSYAKTVNPSENGFEELMLDYSNATLKVAQGFLASYKAATDGAAREEALKAAYSHYTDAPVYSEYESVNEDGYFEWQVFRKNYTAEAIKVLTPYLAPVRAATTLDARYDAFSTLNKLYRKMGIALPADDEDTYKIEGLVAFITEFNEWCVSILSDLIDTADTSDKMIAVTNKYISCDTMYNSVEGFFNNKYIPLLEKMGLKSIKFANELLDKVVVTEENYKTDAPAKLSAVYDYMKAVKFVGLDRAQLADTVVAGHEAVQARYNKYSHEIALCYYGEIAKLIEGEDAEYGKAVSDFVGFLKSCPSIIYRPQAEGYNGKLSEAEALLAAVRSEESEYLKSFAALYAYLSKKAVDPALEGADEFYIAYESLKDEVSDFVETILDDLDSAPTVIGGQNIDEGAFAKELLKLEAIAAFLKDTPVSLSAINKYNSTVESFKLTRQDITCSTLSYKAPVAESFNGTLDAAEVLLGAVEQQWTERYAAFSALYKYMNDKAVSPDENGAAKFYEEYNTLTASVEEAVLSAIKQINSNPGVLESEYGEILYRELAPLSYSGDLAAATELLNKARYALGDENPKLDVIISTFTELWLYVRKTAVAPEIQGSDGFYAEYARAKAQLTEFIVSELDAIKAAELSEAVFDKYDEIYAFVASTLVTKEATEACNAASEVLIGKSQDSFVRDEEAFDESVKNLIKIAEILKGSPVSREAVSDYNALLNDFTVVLKARLDGVYDEFTSAKSELDAYLAAAKVKADELKFVALPEDVDYAAFEAKRAALESYVKIKDIADFIYNSGTGEDGVKIPSIDEYRESFVKVLTDIIAADTLEFSQKPESDIYSGLVTEAQAIIDRYDSAEKREDKAEVYKELYAYMENNAMNPKLNGYEALIERYEAISLEVMRAFISNIDAKTSAADKDAAIKEMRDYLLETPISKLAVDTYNTKYLLTYNAQLKDIYETYCEQTVKLYDYIAGLENSEAIISGISGLSEAIDNYETFEILANVLFYDMKILEDDPNAPVSITGRGDLVKLLKKCVRNHPIAETSYAYDKTMAEVDRILGAYDKLVEDAKNALDAKIPFEEYYSSKFSYNANFDDGESIFKPSAADNSTGKETGTRWDIVEDTARGGKCFKMTYHSSNRSAHISGSLPGKQAFVLELDLTCDEGSVVFPFKRLDRTGSVIQTTIFEIRNNKFHPVVDGAVAPAWQDREVITPGEWTKFIFVYDPVNITLTGYIDYELVGTWSIKFPSDPTLTVSEFRVVPVDTKQTTNSLKIDNFRIYTGTGFRITDKFESMELGDEFTYYVDYMCDETKKADFRYDAYQRATRLLEEVKQSAELAESLAEVIAKYEAVDVDEALVLPLKDAIRDTIAEKCAAMEEYDGIVDTGNYLQVKTILTELENYISTNSAFIDRNGEDYKNASVTITKFKSLLSRCDNVLLLVDALERFDNAYTVATKNKYYANVIKYYELAQLYIEDVKAAVKTDPAVLAFEAKINGVLTPDDDAYLDFLEYYENCQSKIEAQGRKENSDRIIDCIDFITGLEGYEDTVEFWSAEANFAFIDKYMTIIRDIYSAKAYDESVEGVGAAITKFLEIDVYFYQKLQENHVKFIREQIEKYIAAGSYIDKLAVYTYVESYIEANNIDSSNQELAILVKTIESYGSELEVYKQQYGVILAQNTVKFINAVEEMKTRVGYGELKALYDEASVYYYEMNLTEASMAAALVFEQYSVSLKQIEDDTAMFLGYIRSLNSAKNDGALYRALVNCKKYADRASLDIDGVSAGIAQYETKLGEYIAKAELINSDIAEINGVVTAVRTNSIASAVMSVINKIFNR